MRRSLGRVAIYGALLGLASAAVAEAVRPRGGTSVLVDWGQVRQVARTRLETPSRNPSQLAAAAAGYRLMAAELEGPLLDFVGGLPRGAALPQFEALGPGRVRVLDLGIPSARR